MALVKHFVKHSFLREKSEDFDFDFCTATTTTTSIRCWIGKVGRVQKKARAARRKVKRHFVMIFALDFVFSKRKQ